jgi:hypothetical protein
MSLFRKKINQKKLKLLFLFVDIRS